MKFKEYENDLWLKENKLYSYSSIIATIKGKLIYPYKNLTKNNKQHVRYVAEQMNLLIIK